MGLMGAVAVLRSLKNEWKNTPPSWENSNDPCGKVWDGVTCNNSRVTGLVLTAMGLVGELSGDIGKLSELTSLDLSYNKGLTGSLPPQLGLLENLRTLILMECGFSGTIPTELGNLTQLYFLDLSFNNFTGVIPPSLGSLSKLYWLSLANNQFTGSIPVSTLNKPGLDSLKKAKHFLLNDNWLSGSIPYNLFSSDMVLIHVLLNGNQFTGSIPETIGIVQTLEVLNLSHNKLSGPLPNLTGMNSLNYVDLSNNSFEQSEAPGWFSTLSSLATLVVEYGSLQGTVPYELFGHPQIRQVHLKNNNFSGTLNLSSSISQQLELIDLRNNLISYIILGSEYNNTLMLRGNPVCNNSLANTEFCKLQEETSKPYSTSLANCGNKSCVSEQKLSPRSCECAYPYQGTLFFRGPLFRDLSNATTFESLEMSLWVKFNLTPGSVSLDNIFFNSDDYLQVHMGLFPSDEISFNTSEVQRFGVAFSNQTYKPPNDFGPYYFIASAYKFGF